MTTHGSELSQTTAIKKRVLKIRLVYTCCVIYLLFFSEVEADVLHNEILLGAKPKMSRKNESETSTYP